MRVLLRGRRNTKLRFCVEAIHRGFGADLDHGLYRVGCLRHGFLDSRIHLAKYVVHWDNADRRTADAKAYPDEVVAEMLDDRFKTVVATRPATDLHPYGASRKVQIIVHDDELRGLVSGKCCPRIVHERRGLEEYDVLEAKLHRRDLSFLLRAPGAAMAAGELVSDKEADVVAGALVGTARVTETHDDRRLRDPAGWFLLGFSAGAEAEEA